MAELEIALVVHARAIVKEAVIAGDILGVQLGDLGAETRFVVRIVEIGAVGPIEPVKGHDGDEVDILADMVAGQRPEFLEARRIGDHGRAGVEREAVLFPEIGTATGLVAALDDGGGDSGGLQADGERQPAEAGPDNCSFFH